MSNDHDTTTRLIELEVRNQVEQRVSDELDRKTEALTKDFAQKVDHLRTTLRRIGTAVLGVLGIGALTNLTDLFGIPAKIDNAITTRIEAMVKSEDVSNTYHRNLQNIYVEGIISYASIKRKENSNAGYISIPDAIFLINYIFDNKIDFSQFERITILFKDLNININNKGNSIKERYKVNALEALYNGVFGSEAERDKFGWMIVDSKYAIALIEGLGSVENDEFSRDVMDRLRPLSTSQKVPRSVRLAILKQGVARKDTSSIPDFEQATRNNDEEFKNVGFEGLSAVQPTHTSLNVLLDSTHAHSATASRMRLLLRIGKNLCGHKNRTGKIRASSSLALAKILELFGANSRRWQFSPARIQGMDRFKYLRGQLSNHQAFTIVVENSNFWIQTDVSAFAGIGSFGSLIDVCEDAMLETLGQRIEKGDDKTVAALVNAMTVSDRNIILQDPRSLTPLILPALTLSLDQELTCGDEKLVVKSGNILPLVSHQVGADHKVYISVNTDVPAADQKLCELPAVGKHSGLFSFAIRTHQNSYALPE